MNEFIRIERENGKPKIYNKNDKFIIVNFEYDKKVYRYPIPITLPRRNPNLKFNVEEIKNNNISELIPYLQDVYQQLEPSKVSIWKSGHRPNSDDNTKRAQVLRILIDNECVCSQCYLSIISTNPQKYIQNIRDKGFIVSTLNLRCAKCAQNRTHYWLTPCIYTNNVSYETISKKLKKRICNLFDNRDSLLGIKNDNIDSLVPDHKFPEDRWDENTAEINNDNMTDEEIKKKFQLLTLQTNHQKERFCKKCISSNKRAYPCGIKYYYKGTEDWDTNIPTKGKDAEAGCVGCGWYDLLKWKEELNKNIRNNEQKKKS